MSVVVGIDLGTTNSCVAVPAGIDIPGKQQLIADRWLREVGDALVVANRDRSPTTPSVVWVGADGEAQVGLRAKNKAAVSGDGQTKPAMFFKRNMGTDQRITAGHAELTPVEASAHILRHLKTRAEEVLQLPVERAIVTVPAFFEVNAKTETTEAGRLAGLEVVETLIEPVAAALAYSRMGGTAGQAGTFLVYDLGGGTFDTSVVTWDPEEGFESRSFHGDRYLGGYDFDRAIVSWLARQLPSYDLDLDPEDPGDARILAQLLSIAEKTKHDLSAMTETEIVSQHFTDRSGEPMSINEPFSRVDFEELIRSAVESTVTHCDQALEMARVAGSDLDEIVMVGGSSRIPLVGEVLAEHFGRPARILNPDLCVAVGAALKAATATRRSRYLELDHPEATVPATDVGGRILAGEGLDSPAQAEVVLSADDGSLSQRQSPQQDGRFLFEDVPVREGEENGFTVAVLVGGRELDAQQFSLEPGGAAVPPPSGDVLAHDFAVELASGPHTVVEAGTMLPYRTDFRLATATQGTELRVRLYEGEVPIGEVMVADLPGDLPVGSAVEVSLEFELGWTIQAAARVPKVGAEGQATIRIPQRQVPSWEELRRMQRELRQAWDERRAVADPSALMAAGEELDSRLDEIDALLDERQDRAKTHQKFLEAETRLQSVAVAAPGVGGLQPSMAEFEEMMRELEAEIERLAGHDEKAAQSHRAALPGMRDSARKAYAAGHEVDWERAVEQVRSRAARIQQQLPGSTKLPPASELQAAIVQELQALAQTVHQIDAQTGGAHRAEAQQHLSDAQGILSDVVAVDTGDEQGAVRRLAGLYRSQVEPLRERVQQWLDRMKSFQEARGSGGGIVLTLPQRTMGGR